jgi:hypothetical protein
MYLGGQPSWGEELGHSEMHSLKGDGFSLSKSMSSLIVSPLDKPCTLMSESILHMHLS